MRLFLASLLSVAALCAQGGITFVRLQFSPELKSHLELSDDQVSKIMANNEALSQRIADRQRRIMTLSIEMREELAKPSPDPLIVGTRSADMERACREDVDLGKQTREQNLALLTAAQKAKLKALEDAARLSSVVGQAQAANIYRRPLAPAPTPVFGGGRTGDFSFVGLNRQSTLGIPGTGCGLAGLIPFNFVFPVLP